MKESSIRDICNDGTDTDMTRLSGLEVQMPHKLFEGDYEFVSFSASSLNKKRKLNQQMNNGTLDS
ncbi:hypothetical protein BELL_0788g00060 [Botrytis elliptica]|uniref:Uncharacterized protein n=1 Tax=Botrytis elliptica TaxID=278938 RepID=A0A4Z1JJH4_9HELO|nr:hypothetical protein BELL_0788g00060 [Botrytis elliptica]